MKFLFATLSIGFILIGCGDQQKRLPNSVGGQGEILVVMDKAHWEGAPGAAVRELLEQPVAGLPQREPRLQVAHTSPAGFGSLLVAHHNILLAVIGNEADTNAVIRRRNVHATGQLLIQISATDASQWIELFQENSGSTIDLIEGHQRDRIQQRLSKTSDPAIEKALKNIHDLTLPVPTGFRVILQDSNFTWLQRDQFKSGSGLEHNVIEGILVYHYPYTSDSTFNVKSLVDVRDEFTRSYVDGPVEGSYMIVQRGFDDVDLMPDSRATEIDGKFTYIMRGLFGMQGAKMGGPFISLTTVDEARNRVVTVEGFVYAPQFDKREYMREMEAILHSLRILPAGTGNANSRSSD